MSGEPVLIAAVAGRALAQSARRAGFVPLVVDGFGDQDVREAAAHYVALPGTVAHGFEAGPLVNALDDLCEKARGNPIGLVLGSGFEDKTKLMATLDQRYRLIGCTADAVARGKDPDALFSLCDKLGIAHPETSRIPPKNGVGWLSKLIGGAGGAHILDCEPVAQAAPDRYFQRRIENAVPISVMAVVSADGIALEMSRQWTAPSAQKPYRYGGAAIIEYSDSGTEQAMADAASQLAGELGLRGIVSFDFVVTADGPFLIEVNPRPGATLDLFDDHKGNLFRAHVEACRTKDLWQQRLKPALPFRAAAILYADKGALTVARVKWPEWAADRPVLETQIAIEQPIATVFADGETTRAAQQLCAERLSSLADLVYTSCQTR